LSLGVKVRSLESATKAILCPWQRKMVAMGAAEELRIGLMALLTG
jgi:hypothetical protein